MRSFKVRTQPANKAPLSCGHQPYCGVGLCRGWAQEERDKSLLSLGGEKANPRGKSHFGGRFAPFVTWDATEREYRLDKDANL